MSLTSYRAAPPRGGVGGYGVERVFALGIVVLGIVAGPGFQDLAATYSPTP